MNFMHTSEVRPILSLLYQTLSHRILTNVLPLLRVAFAIAQPVMETTVLKSSRIGNRFSQPVFPEPQPAFNGEFQIMRHAEQMQMVRHQEIIAHQPRRSRVFPDVVLGALHGGLRQPAFAFLGADGEKNPVRSTKRNVNSFGRRVTARFTERRFAHGDFLRQCGRMGKIFLVGRRCSVAGLGRETRMEN